VFNIETNTIVESCDVTFDETAPCLCDDFECAGDKEMEESIFVDEELQGFDSDEDDPLHPSTPLPEPIPTSTLEAEAPQATYYLFHNSRMLPLTFRRHIHLNKS
jgi:hypothetical protein